MLLKVSSKRALVDQHGRAALNPFYVMKCTRLEGCAVLPSSLPNGHRRVKAEPSGRSNVPSL